MLPFVLSILIIISNGKYVTFCVLRSHFSGKLLFVLSIFKIQANGQ